MYLLGSPGCHHKYHWRNRITYQWSPLTSRKPISSCWKKLLSRPSNFQNACCEKKTTFLPPSGYLIILFLKSNCSNGKVILDIKNTFWFQDVHIWGFTIPGSRNVKLSIWPRFQGLPIPSRLCKENNQELFGERFSRHSIQNSNGCWKQLPGARVRV